MEDIPLDWFLREGVKKEIVDNIANISRLALKLEIDYINDAHSLASCIDCFVPVITLTAEELEYAMEFAQEVCSMEAMVDKGYLKRVGKGYALTEKGRKKKALLTGEREP
jgi:hypothetical protein